MNDFSEVFFIWCIKMFLVGVGLYIIGITGSQFWGALLVIGAILG